MNWISKENILIVGLGGGHMYQLFPIPEAKPAVEKIIQVVKMR